MVCDNLMKQNIFVTNPRMVLNLHVIKCQYSYIALLGSGFFV